MNRGGAMLEPYRTLAEAAVEVQSRNAKLALEVFEDSVAVLTAQAATTRLLLEQSRKQQEAFGAMVEGSFRAWSGLVYGGTPGDASPVGGASGLPVDDYDSLGVEELGRRLEGLCVRDVEKLKAHERRTRNRRHIMERLDRSLV